MAADKMKLPIGTSIIISIIDVHAEWYWRSLD